MPANAQQCFDVLVAIDKNRSDQQTIASFSTAMVGLKTKFNRYNNFAGLAEYASARIYPNYSRRGFNLYNASTG